MILVDTSVWSVALRRRRRDRSAEETRVYFAWRELIISGEVTLVGPVKQELLSGIANPQRFEEIREQLAAVAEIPLDGGVWERAARYFNVCQRKGVAADAIDMTICAAADYAGIPIFTLDPDFVRYANCLPIALWPLPEGGNGHPR